MARGAFHSLFEPVDAQDDDGPELHLEELRDDDLRAWFALLSELGADYGDSLIWDAQREEDVLVAAHPDPGGSVIEHGSTTTPFFTGRTVDRVRLPRLAFFAGHERIE